MKNIKKISALVLALILVLAMSASALAAGVDTTLSGTTTGTTDSNLGNAAEINTVTVTNNLKAYNPSGDVLAPNITYTFAIAPFTAMGLEVDDENGVNAGVKTGPAGATITYATGSPLSYTIADTLNASSSGSNNSSNVTVTFPANTFSAQGIYRYQITRTVTGSAVTNGTVTLDTNGLSNAVNTVYLDVYVKESGSDVIIYGYVLHAISGDIDDQNNTPKLAGFVDTYYTDNVTIEKDVVNDALAGKFDFAVAFSGTGTKDTDYALTTTASGSPTVTSQTALKIGDNESVTYHGIPYGVAMTITETNNNTGVSYTSAVSGDVDSAVTDKLIASGVSSNDAAVTNNELGTASAKTVTFTNTLAVISPTGVVLRVAPYALILFAGVALLLVSRRRKEAEEA